MTKIISKYISTFPKSKIVKTDKKKKHDLGVGTLKIFLK